MGERGGRDVKQRCCLRWKGQVHVGILKKKHNRKLITAVWPAELAAYLHGLQLSETIKVL